MVSEDNINIFKFDPREKIFVCQNKRIAGKISDLDRIRSCGSNSPTPRGSFAKRLKNQ